MSYFAYGEDGGGDKLNFKSIAGPSTHDQACAATEFYQTKNGSRLYKRLKELEGLVEKTLRLWDNAENALRRYQNKPKDPYYKVENLSELNKLHEAIFESKTTYEKTLMDRQTTWYIIEVVLQGWSKIKKYPSMVLDCEKQLQPLELQLKAAKRKNDFEKCADLDHEIKHLKECITSWSNNWKTTTGSPLPRVPKQPSKTAAGQTFKAAPRQPQKPMSQMHVR